MCSRVVTSRKCRSATVLLMSSHARVVVIGAGMVGHELVRALVEGDGDHAIALVGDEAHRPYDRIHLGRLIEGATPEDLALAPADFYQDADVALHLGDPVVAIDRDERRVMLGRGGALAYDTLVLATGSRAFVPPIPGAIGPGRHVYRTV